MGLWGWGWQSGDSTWKPSLVPLATEQRWGAPSLCSSMEGPLPCAPWPHLLHNTLSAVVDNLLQAFGEVHLCGQEGEVSEGRRGSRSRGEGRGRGRRGRGG